MLLWLPSEITVYGFTPVSKFSIYKAQLHVTQTSSDLLSLASLINTVELLSRKQTVLPPNVRTNRELEWYEWIESLIYGIMCP